MRRWIDLISHHVGPSSKSITLILFKWLCMQFIMVDDSTYIAVDFEIDPELTLLEGEKWGVIGKISSPFFILSFTKKNCAF